MKRTDHNLVQGTELWKAHRAKTFNASDAPAMMGKSKSMTRDQLLENTFFNSRPEISSYTQKIFDQGHEFERLARPWAEHMLDEPLFNSVVSIEIDGMTLGASLDGETLLQDVNWEHKMLNKKLAAGVPNDLIDDQYKIQMEQQMLVGGASRSLFMASSGFEEDMVHCWYDPDLELRAQIIAGWKQFAIDLANYKPKSKPVNVIGAESAGLPVIVCDVVGTEVMTNIYNAIPELQERAKNEMAKDLITDQDFADKEAFNKLVKKSRVDLKIVVTDAKAKFDSYAQFESKCEELDGILQKLQSHGEKAVKTKKEELKNNIVWAAQTTALDFSKTLSDSIQPVSLAQVFNTHLDCAAAIKGKRTLVSMESAVNDLVAAFKIKATAIADEVRVNLVLINSHDTHKLLFADTLNLVLKDRESLEATIKGRISDYEDLQKIEAAKAKMIADDIAAVLSEPVKTEPTITKRDSVEYAPAKESTLEQRFSSAFDLSIGLANEMILFIRNDKGQ